MAHAVQWQYIAQLRDLIADLPHGSITLAEFNQHTPRESIDAWRGANNDWYQHPDRNDFVKYHLEHWFPYLADRMGVDNPMKTPADMLFDYPRIAEGSDESRRSLGVGGQFDVLLINSAPLSNQFPAFDPGALGNLAHALAARGHRVITTAAIPDFYEYRPKKQFHPPINTQDYRLSVTDIGHLSLHCHTIVMVSTGPSWPTFNVWNTGASPARTSVKNRVILIDTERVDLDPMATHVNSVPAAAEALRSIGLL